jgi:hypothetical protein
MCVYKNTHSLDVKMESLQVSRKALGSKQQIADPGVRAV